MPKKKKSEKLSPEQHFANLQWLKSFYGRLDARQWHDFKRLEKELSEKSGKAVDYTEK